MATILIVGASKGIGLEIARQLRARQHVVIGTSRTPKDDSLLELDITDADSVDGFMRALGEHPIDAMIYCAGYDLYSAAEDTRMEELMAQIDANFLGAVRMAQAVLPLMRQSDQGKLIFLSSLGGLNALPFNSAYSASKFALEGYAESLRYELLPLGIYVSLIEPGQVKTDTLATSIQSISRTSRYGVSSPWLAERARKEGAKARLSVRHVAKTVVAVIESRAPRLRYFVGTQTRAVMLMRQMVPAWMFEAFIVGRFVRSAL
jgi:short-subunit dehydrogenase